MFTVLPLFLAFGATGCADMALVANDAGGYGSDTAQESHGVDSGDDADTADELPVAAWYSLEGAVVIREGLPVTDELRLHFLLADAALHPWTCADMELSSLQVAEPPTSEDVELYAWWTLTVPTDASCRETGLPRELGFGIGELSPEVRARLGTVDLEDAADRLYGAWLVADGGEPFPFGYAEGAMVEAADGPPPDDTYALEPLLVVELPPEE